MQSKSRNRNKPSSHIIICTWIYSFIDVVVCPVARREQGFTRVGDSILQHGTSYFLAYFWWHLWVSWPQKSAYCLQHYHSCRNADLFVRDFIIIYSPWTICHGVWLREVNLWQSLLRVILDYIWLQIFPDDFINKLIIPYSPNDNSLGVTRSYIAEHSKKSDRTTSLAMLT